MKTQLLTMFLTIFSIGVFAKVNTAQSASHEMQHGFILSADDKFASHLVATGHHSWQSDVTGELSISDLAENENYKKRKRSEGSANTYFLFQAQKLDLQSLQVGQVLTGHIIESQKGKYEPKNVIVRNATFTVDQVLLNLANPFFGEE